MVRVRRWYATVIVAAVVAYVVVPAARFPVVVAAGVVSVGAIGFGVRRLRPERAGAWRVLQVAVALLALHVLVALVEDGSAARGSYPTVSDLVSLAAYLPLSIGLFWLGRCRAPSREETSLIDAMSVTLAGALILWVTLVQPAAESGALSAPARVVASMSLVGIIAVFAASVRFVLGWRRNVALIILSLGLLCFLSADVFHGHLVVRSAWAGNAALVDLGHVALVAACGAAALDPSMRDVGSPVSQRHTLRPWRLAVIAMALLAAPTVLLILAVDGPVQVGLAIAVGGALVSGLVLARLATSGRAYRARAAREHAIRVASQAMVSAVSRADVLAGARKALRSLEWEHGPIVVELADRRGSDDPWTDIVAVDSVVHGELVVPLRGLESAFVYSARVRVVGELADLLVSLADQAALALQRVRLAEIAKAEERDRHFRTLVLTSTDVILIGRDGQIEYATPSAETMFGRDVMWENFDNIVQRSDRRDFGQPWPKTVDGVEGVVNGPGGDTTVVVHRRDLTQDPTVRGTVTTLRDVTAERELQRNLAYLARHDELTGMANTRAWNEAVSSEMERRRRPGDGIAVIFVDVDNFKLINDRHGHPTGDRVLAVMASRIRACVRTGDVAARVGGDEFAVLLRSLSNIDDARIVAQRLAETLAEPIVVNGGQIECMASIGLSYTEGRERIDALVHQADTALYAAKEQGKGRWTEYNAKQWAPHRSTHNGGLAM